jgi:hypothetical protein
MAPTARGGEHDPRVSVHGLETFDRLTPGVPLCRIWAMFESAFKEPAIDQVSGM